MPDGTAFNYALSQGAIEAGAELIPAGALISKFKATSPFASVIKRPLKYILSEGVGEQVATLSQNYMQGEFIDSRANPDWK